MCYLLLFYVQNIYAKSTFTFIDGNKLYADMLEDEKIEHGFEGSLYKSGEYTGYIIGVADSTIGVDWCAPENIKVNQIRKVVAKFLEDNPDKHHFTASSLVIGALHESFPCKKQNIK